MENKRVYTHYYRNDDIEYRWRTIIQIGNSWEECGTIFMKNPGSSTHCEKTPSPITNEDILNNLRKYDYEEKTNPCEWYEFSVDNTMTYVIKLFEAYYRKPLNGVIQIFNLFNIRGANLGEAIKKSNGNIFEELAYTVDYDINHIVSPVYLGWGDLWKNKKFSKNADKIFDEVKKKTSYLCDGIQNNNYYHPQYLMNYGKNKLDCIITLTRFIKDEIKPKELDSIEKLICLRQKIDAKGVISTIVNETTLIYEYFCKGLGGFIRQNGIISIGLEYNYERRKYILSTHSNGNHPELFKKLISDYCISKGWIKSDSDFSFFVSISIDDDRIVEFMTTILQKMKKYRETDTKK